MARRMIFPLALGIVGAAILIALGVWQAQRLAWKQAVLSQIEARIGAEPVALPEVPDPEVHQYLPVAVTGDYIGDDLAVLASIRDAGAVYRLIAVMELASGRRIMVDRGYVPAGSKYRTGPAGSVNVTGNLLWPDEVDGWTPAPDMAKGLWFARDVAAMADELGTEPVLVVVRDTSHKGTPATPLPVGVIGIPNDHLNYAITWFSLAAIWLGMTVYLLWRIRQRTV